MVRVTSANEGWENRGRTFIYEGVDSERCWLIATPTSVGIQREPFEDGLRYGVAGGLGGAATGIETGMGRGGT